MSDKAEESQSQEINHTQKRQYYPETEIKNIEDQQLNYYNQYCRLYLANHILAAQLKEINLQKNQLITKLSKLEKRAEELSEGNSGQMDQKKRRIRRSAVDIARHYKCQVEGCTKSYGLNQHIKLKHPEIFKGGDRQFVVKEYDNEDDESL